MEYKTYETDSSIDLEQELNYLSKDGWILVSVTWNQDSECYLATLKK